MLGNYPPLSESSCPFQGFISEEEFFPHKCFDHLPLHLPMLASECAFCSDLESHLHLASSNVAFVCFEISLLLHGQIEY